MTLQSPTVPERDRKPLTPVQQEIASYAEEGLTLSEIAEERDVSIASVRHAARRGQISIIRENERTYRQIASQMKPAAAVEYLLGVLELAAPHLTNTTVADELGIDFTRKERRLFCILHRSLGRHLTKDQIFDHLYADCPYGDVPELKIVDVFVCKIRAKLKGSAFKISTVWGEGFRLEQVQ